MIKGYAWKYGKNVDTDVIIAGRYCNISDPQELAKHCMEDIDPEFTKKITKGDIIVADSNFGCGSSREVAPLAIKFAGISCIIASSFARIFFRNSVNIGLPVLECPEAVQGISEGDEVEIDPFTGVIKNLTKELEFKAVPLPPFVQKIIELGGLMNYVVQKLEIRELEIRD